MAYIGIIEGFYGKQFKPETRSVLLQALQQNGGSFYIYAPKEERVLRQDLLRSVMAPPKMQRLLTLKQECSHLGLDFGLALSPFNLTHCYLEVKEKFLKQLTDYCSALQPDILCLLFDDQKVDGSHAAAVQNRIIQDAYAKLPACVKRFIICPSYYSFDPILEKLFGPRPQDYFTTLCYQLPDKVEIFWTGNQVLSPDIEPADLQAAAAMLGRTPFIWDNYPVNDGKYSSNFLPLKPFGLRRNLEAASCGHAINPMLEGVLNLPVITTLFKQYQNEAPSNIAAQFNCDLSVLLGKGAPILMEQLHLLTERGLSSLNALQKAMLIAACELEPKNAALREIKAFLQGKYVFDPACLT